MSLFGLAGLAAVLVGVGLGLAFRQAWIFPHRFQQAERLWQQGAPAAEVLVPLDRSLLARGELGYRVQLLRSLAHLELGNRLQAWQASFRAGLTRLPFWHRWPIALYLMTQAKLPKRWSHSLGERMGRRLPGGQRFHHFLAAQQFRAGDPDTAWPLMELALEGCQEDPLVLEDLMLSALGRMQAPDRKAELGTTLAHLFERSLSLLTKRHGDSRCSWNRLAPLPYLMATGKTAEVLSLARSLPEPRRPMGLWEAECLALRELGDLPAAEASAIQGLELHPTSFRLWMERHALALQRRDAPQALQSLEQARPLIEMQEDAAESQWEWMLRRAEFAYWAEGDAAQAWTLLSGIPQTHQGRQHPPFRLQVQVALGHYTEAFTAIQPLLEQSPQDVDLLLLQADCMGGMGTWEALLPFLESFQATGAPRSDYWHLLGLSHAHLRHRLPARECLERASAMDLNQVRLALDAGHACMELAEWERAEYHWRHALELDPQSEEALLQLSETRRALHDPAGAKAILRECLLAHPESEEAQGYLAELEAN